MNEPKQREEALFEAAVHLSPAQRAGWLDAACGADARLRQAVDVLLQAHEKAGTFLAQPPSPTVKLDLAPDEALGASIGRYKLLEKVGEGGFGAVYVAEQREPVKRRVALKIIKLGMDTRQVVARFEAERQALAMMDHPNIAKVLDAGATETGRPFFVMELVRGVKITEYCDQNNLSTQERLELFIKVCQAIQHAHQKGIIHRDIKASNILVTLHDGVPVPKVIDFGIAKATQGELTDKTVYTQLQQFIGTPAYMSPEQAEMSGLDVDTRSDIYSLGVLLYELLTGSTPFDQKTLAAAGLDGMRRMIREQEPMRPSTRVNSLKGEERTTTAKRRGADPPRLIHMLSGDLDWIVMKCLEKDRTRRYETANGLAMDIQRHLHNEPVVARPPSKLYRLGKSVRRNKLAFAVVTATALALLLGAVVSAWQAVRAGRAELTARRERDTAARARQQAEAINQFLTKDLLYQATPEANAREKKVTMEDVLAAASRKLDQNPEMARQPEVEASLRLAFGGTYFRLGQLAEAEKDFRRAVTLRRAAFGPEHVDTLAAQQQMAEFLAGIKKYQDAESVARETWLAQQRILGAENRNTLNTLSAYIEALCEQGKLEESEKLARQRLQTCQRVFGPDDRDTVVAVDNLAYVLATGGNYPEAERYQREALKGFERIGMADKFDAGYAINNIAMFRFMQGDAVEAEKLLVGARPRAINNFGPEHVITLHVQHVLARVLAEEGKLDQAETLARETLAVRRRVMPEGHEGTGRTLLYLGAILVQKGKLDEAEPHLKEALTLFRQHYGKKQNLIAHVENWLGVIQLERHAYPEAEALLLAGPDHLLTRTAALSPKERRMALEHIVKLYQVWGKPDEAARWQHKLDAAASLSAAR